MRSATTVDVLNRLVALHRRSLPVYLSDALPWLRKGNEEAMRTLLAIAEDHQDYADRLAGLVLESGAAAASGEFPMEFTGYHDLSFDYLLGLVADRQEQLVAEIQQCVEQLATPLARAVGEEALGAAEAHLDMLRELSRPAST